VAVVTVVVHRETPPTSTASAVKSPQQRAVNAAQKLARNWSTGTVTLVSVASGRFGDFDPNSGVIVSSPERKVWAVKFRGKAFGMGSCALFQTGTPRPCPASNASIEVIIDYTTDAFISGDIRGGP
jgi:hypothetical protein